MLSATRIASRNATTTMNRTITLVRRSFVSASHQAPSRTGTAPASSAWALAAAGGVALTLAAAVTADTSSTTKYTCLDSRVPVGGDIISTGTPVTERATGIAFPQLCNGYYLAGCGVRVKWAIIKVYAVGTYLDPLAMSAVKNSSPEVIQDALLNPTYPRTIRIVMARGLSIQKYMDGIVESLEPRMMGMDLEKLEEFKKLNPPVDLVKGAEMEMTIRGDTLLYKNAVGGVGTIRSEIFTRALCDVYYGDDCVSPTHKAAVLEGIPKL